MYGCSAAKRRCSAGPGGRPQSSCRALRTSRHRTRKRDARVRQCSRSAQWFEHHGSTTPAERPHAACHWAGSVVPWPQAMELPKRLWSWAERQSQLAGRSGRTVPLNLSPSGLCEKWLAAIPFINRASTFACVAAATSRNNIGRLVKAASFQGQNMISLNA